MATLTEQQRVFDKYKQMATERMKNNMPLGEYCEYCHGTTFEKVLFGCRACTSCGASTPKLFCFAVGMPVYDIEDYRVILESGMV